MLPHLAEITNDRINEAGGQILARSEQEQAAYPGCGTESARVHGSCHRRLADIALAGRPVVIRLLVRRLVRRGAACTRVTVVEQIPGLTRPHCDTAHRRGGR